ncbi:undecaprenyldiphospho-muramoylpentapeptide beta-N-acetylglucosaminyltransferase [Hydrogenimonas thermophila]|uniref:UDP-N-acetylglucosamine--N-acetylmuramyl-(pentapeptide) pyrophosphoryl-undecaprenol N-acetylglucosamine transferase n=1 Tax=Hydrogenimonas thermophila TaxID=223786 RepID=A0A1I5P420_9BACT|nr:undecaprenyldiphospho-muramoylpentapeptide beta-N-acetylglucosaminyltransferase [Hydrogenimonas thermophila]WOE69583.1 undecaprenyldiphospho-muramoylpentapeptide beta-N-acetylglucosaminyltransferase [Hydrogenimonas thermophila]WOE72097.1 undecaprenyldiphospho-muramoylpentapeptide beta-N-acetylglucosaminyltransferase [Hydrogenimonas thermophila]SFP28271.1 UDP-N-acetylglucosamine-N-acetylmuramylpentapeptide N-acetylglucosamine transferase [Hydrogenimonas thermophila]
MQHCNILLTGGGTGGHLAIVRSVKDELLKRGINTYYIGSESGQDRAWFEKDDDFKDKLFLPTRGVVNQKGLDKLYSISQIFKSMLQAKEFMKAHNIDAVLSVGGFSAAPASFAAILIRIPLFIHEQNALTGRLNKILKPFSKHFFSSYGSDPVDYPVSENFFKTARVRSEVKRVIFLGGSQGAKAINDFALQLAPELQKLGIGIIHQTGKRDYERVSKEYKKLNIEADVFAFDKEIYLRIEKADLAVSRAGASTLWELTAAQIPTLFIPYPYAAGDHQYYNAAYHVGMNAGWVVRQNMLERDIFLNIIDSNIEVVSKRLGTMISQNGACKIVKTILDLVKA